MQTQVCGGIVVVFACLLCICIDDGVGCVEGYYLSIPSAVERNPNFQTIVREVPMEQLLTETDSPYMGPDKGDTFAECTNRYSTHHDDDRSTK